MGVWGTGVGYVGMEGYVWHGSVGNRSVWGGCVGNRGMGGQCTGKGEERKGSACLTSCYLAQHCFLHLDQDFHLQCT